MIQSVLIVGNEPRISVVIARSLSLQNIKVDVSSLLQKEPKLSSRAIRNVVPLPCYQHSPHDFIAALSELIETERYSMLIPCNDSALIAISQHYEHLNTLLHVGCPPPHILNRVLDKGITMEAAKLSKIAIPFTYRVSHIDELDNLRNTFKFPVIGKPRNKNEASDFKILYFQNFKELKDAFIADNQFGKKNLLQEYCIGEGVGIGVIIHNGEPVVMFQHRRLKELPSTGGVSVMAISEELNPLLAENALKLLRNLEWEGIAMVEFRYNRAENTAVLMEVNGRYWGSISAAIHAGIDFPFYEWQLAHGKQLNVPSGYKKGIRVRWIAGDILRLHGIFVDFKKERIFQLSRWKELVHFIMDFKPQTRTMLWAFNDPISALTEIILTVKSIVKADIKVFINYLIPSGIKRHIKNYLCLNQREASVYMKFQILHALRMRRNHIKRIPTRISSILFVCHGNIIRSPMAAVVLEQVLSNAGHNSISVTSAGLHAKPSRSADIRALSVARDFNVSLDNHRAQQLTREMVKNSDIIFVMDYLNEARMVAKYPETINKTFMLGAFENKTKTKRFEIADPYNGDINDIRRCYEIIQSCITNLVSVLLT